MKLLATHPQVGEVEILYYNKSEGHLATYKYQSNSFFNKGITSINNLSNWRVEE